MPEILHWQDGPDRGEIVQQAVQALMEGRLVAFPTETIYGLAAAAWLPEAVDRLAECKGRQDLKPMALAIRAPEEIRRWVPKLGQMGWRLARRCLPGPLTLVCDMDSGEGFAEQLPESVRRWVCPAETLGLRVPDHDAILHVLHSLPGPLVLTSANPSGGAEATRAGEVARTFGDRLALIIDDGPSPLGRASTVVHIQGENWKVVREGVISSAVLQSLTACLIVFVCTGNTCRSPLAEALCKKMLADQLQCPVEELPQHGFLVRSAGMAAITGDRATPEAIETARELGVDLQSHQSQPVTGELVFQADYLVAMTQTHVQNLLSRFPHDAPTPVLLCPEGADVPDPIGCDKAVYRECAKLLQKYLEPWVRKFQER
jgi:tRNA threonylcarbamoyl adenosine modification protein (Sua5/YciO/YrdC/YwlC family)